MRWLAFALIATLAGAAFAQAESLTLNGVRTAIWRPRQPGPHPLVIFSHGFHAMARQSRFLTSALAARGWLVVAPEHADSMRPEVPFGRTDAWTDQTYQRRHDDIAAVVKALKEPAWQVDWSRLVLAGHSLGGYTALGCAGAWPSWKIPGVTAVLALSPYAQPFARHRTLANLHVPVMYMSGTRDLGILPFLRRKGGIWDQTSAPAWLVVLEGAGHFAFSDVPSPRHAEIVAYALGFVEGSPAKQAHTSEFRAK